MENISVEFNNALVVLTWTVTAFLLIIGILLYFVVKRVLSILTSCDKLVENLNVEFTPTMKEVQTTLKHISSISDKADKHIGELSSTLDTAQKGTNSVVNKAKINFLSLIFGFNEGVKKFVTKE